MHRTKIIATLGPASQDPGVLTGMVRAGLNVVRLNLAHGNHDEHGSRLEAAKRAADAAGVRLGCIADIAGPEIRTTGLPAGGLDIAAGHEVVFAPAADGAAASQPGGEAADARQAVPIDYPGLAGDVRPGQRVLMDDGNLVLEVAAIEGRRVVARVIAGGRLLAGKKLILPGADLKLPALNEKDLAAIAFAAKAGVDYIAASFVRRPEDIAAIKRAIADAGGDQQVIAKIENAGGLANLDAILEVSDGLMVARGDLGVEIPAEEVPLLQKSMINQARTAGKPVITATQMLESMVERPVPTRAEASDVANAIFDGSDAIMLSGETAVGQFPVDSVATMAKIAQRTERALEYATILAQKSISPLRTVTDAISHATVTTAQDLGAAAIITATRSGYTARMVSKYRPQAPVIAVTPDRSVARTLSLVWGVTTVVKGEATSTDEMIDRAVEGALQAGLIKNGDLVVITAGVPVGIQGTTNLIKVHTVGDVLIRGVGIGQRAATGRARVARTPRELEAFELGDILVTIGTDLDFMPFVEMASAVVAEEGGLTSHAAIVGLNLGIPVIVGAEGATGIITDGTIITVDGSHGLVYRGQATVK